MMKKVLGATALILPTILLLTLVTVRLDELKTAPTVRLPITGYDPVHILHGRYIQFQFDHNHIKNMPRHFEMSGGLCLKPHNSGLSDAIFYMRKDSRCTSVWTERVDYFRSSHKYFLDERYALPLEKIIRKNRRVLSARKYMERENKNPSVAAKKKYAYYLEQEALAKEPSFTTSVDLAISKSGAMHIKMLYIGGLPWTEFVQKKKSNF